MSHTLSNILNGDFNFYQSHFLVRYLYFNWSMAFRYFMHHWFLLTSYCWGKVLAKGKGRTETHLFLSWDLTSKTLLSLVQLKRDRQRKSVRRLCSAVCVCVRERLSIRLHLCLALEVQYFSAWSGSLTSPSLQHWPHTNFIISSSLWPLTSAFPVPCTGPMFPFISSILIGLFDLASVILFGEREVTTAGWWKHNINRVEKCFIND